MVAYLERKTAQWEAYGIVRAYPGEVVSGDQVFAEPTTNGLLFGLVDGLGHGKEAAAVADGIKKYVEEYPSPNLIALIKKIHQEFKGSRGAVIGIGHCDTEGNLKYIGVGNISCRIVGIGQKNLGLLSRNGVIGQRYQRLQLVEHQLQVYDRVVLYSDGISRSSLQKYKDFPFQGSKKFIDTIVQNFGKDYDDASFLYINRSK
ncbi:MAG: SpoIIE family protein phosphatase [Saprospiraceae bacterium]|nr:SpoIIE family protein phosphatase [Saprospiraceae bacterium]